MRSRTWPTRPARDGVEAIAAVGTAGLRIAREQRRASSTAVRERTGVEVEVISGEEEGRLAYLAATSELELGDGSLVVFDTGGGSSQFTFGHGEQVEERFSVDVGAVRFTERFGLDGRRRRGRWPAALGAIAADLARARRPAAARRARRDGRRGHEPRRGQARARDYDPDVVRGTVLDRAEIDRQIELYRTRDRRRAARDRRPPAEARRGDPRRRLHRRAPCSTKLGRDSLTVSDRGLRHGLLRGALRPRLAASRRAFAR